MMGSGSFDSGRLSSSSSNLSALAPPFTVDRSNPKPNSNPLCHFSDSPYVASFNHHRPYPNSSTPRPVSNSILDSEIASTLTTCLPVESNYHHSASEFANPPTAYWPAPQPSAKPTIDAFSYSTQPQPYYHQYASPTASDTSYDLSTTPGLVSLNISSPVDYTGTLSGLEYMPQWGSSWNGLAGEEQGKLIELDDNFCLEEKNGTGSVVYKHKKNQGTCSLIPQSQPQALSLEPATNTLQYSPHQQSFQTLNSHTNDCVSVTKSSPALVIRPPPVGTSCRASNPVSPKAVDGDSTKAVNNEDLDAHSFVKAKAAAVPPSAEGNVGCLDASRLSFHIKQNDHTRAALTSTNEELLNKPFNENTLGPRLKATSTSQVPDIKVAAGFSWGVDGVDVNTTAKSTDCLDHHNPAVDSPCWKGAPGFHFSQFEVFEADTEQHPTKKLGTCNALDLQEIQTFPHGGLVSVSSPKPCESSNLNEKMCVENHFSLSAKKLSDANDTAKEYSLGDDVKSGAVLPQTSREGVQFSDDINKPSKEYDLPGESKCGSEPSYTKRLRVEDGTIIFTKIKSQDSIPDTGTKNNDTSEDSNVPAVEYVSCLHSSGEFATNLAKPDGRESTAKMDVQMLTNTMHNLSKLLLFHCSTNSCDLTERDYEMVKWVIYNLHACLPMRSEQVTPMPESVFPQGGTPILKESPDHLMRASGGQSWVTNKAAADFCAQLDTLHVHEKKESYNVSGNFVSLKDDANISRSASTVQTIRTILDENFKSEEEMLSQTLLYKNMWLEAEAELCSVNCRARLARMRIEMEKAKDVSKSTSVVQKLVSADPIPQKLADPNKPPSLPCNVKDGSVCQTSDQDSPITGTTGYVNDVEASVLARFRILKCQGEKSNSINVEELPESANTGFAGKSKSNQRPSKRHQLRDGIVNVATEYHLQCRTGNNGNKDKVGSCVNSSLHETIKDFQVGTTEEAMVQASRNNMLLNQRPSGYCDKTSLGWEHVLNDEYSWPN